MRVRTFFVRAGASVEMHTAYPLKLHPTKQGIFGTLALFLSVENADPTSSSVTGVPAFLGLALSNVGVIQLAQLIPKKLNAVIIRHSVPI